LQRQVIQRLRDAQYDTLADAAEEAWRRAESHPLALPISDERLVADYQKANTQLLTGFVDRRLAR
jgi:hypothetical protein